MADLTTFYETKKSFIDYVFPKGNIKSLSFEDWNALPHEKKAAALFIQFFGKVIQAWDKANAFDFIPAPDGVSIVLQYLEKNVKHIENDPKRYSEPYMYRVSYNCMYCICHDPQSVKDRWENETSQYVMTSEGEFNVIDAQQDERGSAADQLDATDFQHRFWDIIEDTGLPSQKVLDYLLSGDVKDLKKVRKSKKFRNNDPLRDVEVRVEEVEGIIETLKENLADLHYEMFGDNDDNTLTKEDAEALMDDIKSAYSGAKSSIDDLIDQIRLAYSNINWRVQEAG